MSIILNHFREQLAQRAHGVEGERQHARHGAEAEGHHEQQGEDDFRHGAQEFQRAAGCEADQRRADEVGAGEEAQAEGADGARRRCRDRR